MTNAMTVTKTIDDEAHVDDAHRRTNEDTGERLAMVMMVMVMVMVMLMMMMMVMMVMMMMILFDEADMVMMMI